ncbi:protein rapunzel isoform X1 [Fundulus heteroclitus]|uniref:protein rapunzel isoform X1 n=1 Tax=Fundulus heteroclitus TaxID=8078 RepID=UPI00165CD306|nr:protein rapunzel isoform X1 [Fundulus heteroclitus]
MNSVADWLVQNRDKVEKGVEIMGQASEVLAYTVGQLHPILEAVFMASAELLKDPDSKEAQYLTQQFEQVNARLEGITEEINTIALEMMKSTMNKQNFDLEANILSQYDKFQDFVNAKPEYRQTKKKKFLSHYENTNADLNMFSLYNSVKGDNISGDPIMDTVLATTKRDRRAVENFCALLKRLFVKGLIVIVAHAALKEGSSGEEIVKMWKDRMEDVEKCMKDAVDECTKNFAEQAKTDMELLLQADTGTVNSEFVNKLLDSLSRKYDWVRWSIRAFRNRERIFFFNWMAGKKFHGSGGANWFDILTKNKIKVVFSFCVDPKPINKSQVVEQIEKQKLKGNMMAVALSLQKCFPNCLVHAVSHYKAVMETNNFMEDCYYYGQHQKAYVCIHPE